MEENICCDYIHVHEDKVLGLKDKIPSDAVTQATADLFKVFGDYNRIRILYLIEKDEICVCDIARLLDMSQSAVSHQLRVLKNMRLVKSRREKKTIFYTLDDEHVKNILNQGIEHVMEVVKV